MSAAEQVTFVDEILTTQGSLTTEVDLKDLKIIQLKACPRAGDAHQYVNLPSRALSASQTLAEQPS